MRDKKECWHGGVPTNAKKFNVVMFHIMQKSQIPQNFNKQICAPSTRHVCLILSPIKTILQ